MPYQFVWMEFNMFEHALLYVQDFFSNYDLTSVIICYVFPGVRFLKRHVSPSRKSSTSKILIMLKKSILGSTTTPLKHDTSFKISPRFVNKFFLHTTTQAHQSSFPPSSNVFTFSH